MVAASRRPRLRPCAPIGARTCAASPMSARRGAPKRLTMGAAFGFDASSSAAERAAAVGADQEFPRDGSSVAAHRRVLPLDRDRVGTIIEAGEGGELRSARLQRGDEKAVLDIVPERVE